MKLGAVKNHGFDADGYERCERLEALAECPKCGKEVECWADTEEWFNKGGKWFHGQYGGAHGVCEDCHLLIADCLSDGFRVFNLKEEAP